MFIASPVWCDGCPSATRHGSRAAAFWLLVWSFFFVAYLMLLFQIFGDPLRDQMSGWFKALWVVALIVASFLSALI